MNWLRFMLGVLGTWRLTHLFVSEHGPWNMLTKLRKAISRIDGGKLLDCFYCASLWVSVPFCLLIGATLLDRLLLWPALSAAAILLENLSTRLGQPAAAGYFVEGDQNNDLLREERQYSRPAE